MNINEIQDENNNQSSDLRDNSANNLNSDNDDQNLNVKDAFNNNNNYNNNDQNLEMSFQHQGNREYDPPTEAQQPLYLHNLYDSRSPQKSRYVLEDLRATLKNTYENQLQRFLFQNESAKKREEQLLSNKAKLEQQLLFWRSKANESQILKENEKNFNDDLTNKQLQAFEDSKNLELSILLLEKDKLQNALNERNKEADEWQHKATEFEERFLTNNRIQFELQSYERRIQKAIDDNADKAKEYEDNQMILAKLELTHADILKLEEELNTVKEMVDFRHKDGLELKAQIDALSLDDNNGKLLVAKLHDNERRLDAQISLLKSNLAAVIAKKENELKNTQIKNEVLLQNQKQVQQNQKQQLNTHKRVLESNILNRNGDINNFRLHNNNLDKQLRDTIQVERNLSIEAEREHIRHDSAELEKRRNIELEQATKHNTIEKLNREQAFQRSVLHGKINQLSQAVNNRSLDVAKTREQLRHTENEKILKQIEKSELEKRLHDWTVRFQLTQQAQEQELRNKEIAQQRHLSHVDLTHKVQENHLAKETQNLDVIYNVNKRNHDLAVQRVNHFNNLLVDTQIKERQTSAEAENWKNRTAQIERTKNLELELSIERKRREIDNLSRSQSFEKELALKQKVEILNLLNQKERENNHIKFDNTRALHEYHSNSAEKAIAQSNANYFKHRTDLNVHQTINDSIVHENITRNTLNHINAVRNTEKNFIARDINTLANSAAIHQTDAIIHRNGANNVIHNNLLRYPSIVYY